MRRMWDTIWNSEPVVFVGAAVSAWGAIVAFDQANDTWYLPLWAYIIAVPLTAFLTGVVRNKVTPTNGGN